MGFFTRSTLDKSLLVLTVLHCDKRTESALCLAASLKSKSHPATYAAMTLHVISVHTDDFLVI